MNVDGKWVYWPDQCKVCKNSIRWSKEDGIKFQCLDPTAEAIKDLILWQKEHKFYGSLNLKCDYLFIDEERYEEMYGKDSAACNS